MTSNKEIQRAKVQAVWDDPILRAKRVEVIKSRASKYKGVPRSQEDKDKMRKGHAVLNAWTKEFARAVESFYGGKVFHPSVCDLIHITKRGDVQLIELKMPRDSLRPKQKLALSLTKKYSVVRY